MAGNYRSFVVGNGEYPKWFKEETSKGRARVNYEGDKATSITIYGATKNYTAKPGDVILINQNGMTVTDQATVAKLNAQNQKKEEKKNV